MTRIDADFLFWEFPGIGNGLLQKGESDSNAEFYARVYGLKYMEIKRGLISDISFQKLRFATHLDSTLECKREVRSA
jgi:hypothetical protein